MRVFKVKAFGKWARKQGLGDEELNGAIQEISDGLFDANLGGNVFKKRVAMKGQGKRGSTRTLIAFKIKDRAFFMYGFDKGSRSNIDRDEEKALKILGKTLLNWSEKELSKRIDEGELVEITEVNDGR